jgi:hypothetical protein
MRGKSPRASLPSVQQFQAGHLEVPDRKRRAQAGRTTAHSLVEPSRALWTRLVPRSITPPVIAGTRFVLCPPRPTMFSLVRGLRLLVGHGLRRAR